MVTEAVLDEYLDEIRKNVCSVCVEHLPGGPPCAPLAKVCGIEVHLLELINTIHDVHSSLIEPYLDHNRSEICSNCTSLHSNMCPCPMDYLAVPLVQAVEAVDDRRAKHDGQRRVISALLRSGRPDVDNIVESFAEAAGTWKGCDWPTRFGRTCLDLNGCTAAEAAAEAAAATNTAPAQWEDWHFAASWLASLEKFADEAETNALHAVESAKMGDWPNALKHARWARALEFACGGPRRRNGQLIWGPFCKVVEEAAGASTKPSCVGCGK